MLALLKVLGRSCYALVGHDWGAILAWHLGCLFPEAFPRSFGGTGVWRMGWEVEKWDMTKVIHAGH